MLVLHLGLLGSFDVACDVFVSTRRGLHKHVFLDLFLAGLELLRSREEIDLPPLPGLRHVLRLLPEQMDGPAAPLYKGVNHQSELTRYVGDGLQLLKPVLGDLHGHGFLVSAGRSIPLSVGVSHYLRNVLLVDRVQYVPEILSVNSAALGQLGRHVLHELLVGNHQRPQPHHGQLIVERNVDELHFRQLHQLFLVNEDLLQKATQG